MTLIYAASGIIAVCLIAIAVILVRKFPQAALVDTDAMPEEVAARKKKEIIHDRVSRMVDGWKRGIVGTFRPLGSRAHAWFGGRFRRLLALERQLTRLSMTRAEIRQKTTQLLLDADALMTANKHDEAERKLIEVVSLDTKNMPAYRGLGNLYMAAKHYDQARETFAFLVKVSLRQLCKGRVRTGWFMGGGAVEAELRAAECSADAAGRGEIAKNYADLGLACRASDQFGASRDALENAVAFEPANPRYLDLLLENCILEGAKKRAKEVFGALKSANPENQKLQAIARDIAGIPDERPRGTKRKKMPEPAQTLF